MLDTTFTVLDSLAKPIPHSTSSMQAYGAGGVGFIIESLSDNKNRTASDVRDVVKKSGGNMAESGVRLPIPCQFRLHVKLMRLSFCDIAIDF